jgi:hypothetical protein
MWLRYGDAIRNHSEAVADTPGSVLQNSAAIGCLAHQRSTCAAPSAPLQPTQSPSTYATYSSENMQSMKCLTETGQRLLLMDSVHQCNRLSSSTRLTRSSTLTPSPILPATCTTITQNITHPASNLHHHHTKHHPHEPPSHTL